MLVTNKEAPLSSSVIQIMRDAEDEILSLDTLSQEDAEAKKSKLYHNIFISYCVV